MPALLNELGRIVVVHPDRYHWYIETHGYKPMPYHEKGLSPESGVAAVVRQEGGLGDVICVQAAVAGLQAEGWRVRLHAPKLYEPVSVADEFVDTTARSLRRSDVLEGAARVHWMFCPAGDHEAVHNMRPFRGRIENFCDAAEVAPRRPPIELAPLAPIPWALDEPGDAPHVGLQVASENPAKDLTPRQWCEVVKVLHANRATVHIFHHKEVDFIHELGADHVFIGHPLREVISRVWGMDAFCAVDSGLFHVASAFCVPTVGLFGPTNGPITCRYYPETEIIQADQPADDEPVCHTPCYYSKARNKFHCKGKPGACMQDLDPRKIAEATILRASRAPIEHRISKRWAALNPETLPAGIYA